MDDANTPAGIAAAEERFFALSLDLLAVVGFDGYIKRVNPAWERLSGWTPEDLMSKPYAEFIHPDDRERTLAEAARLAEHGAATSDFELRFVTRDRGLKWILFSAQGIPEEQVIYAVGKDITGRKAEEANLEQSEQRFRAVTESVTDAIISADADGRIVFWNRGAAAIFGYDAGEAMGLELTVLMPERYRERHLAGLRRLREDGESSVVGRTLELNGLRRDGAEFPLELSLGSWHQADQRYYTAVIRDLSVRQRAERYLIAQHAVEAVLVESPPLEDAIPRLLAAMAESLEWEAGGYWKHDPDADVMRCVAFWGRDPERLREFEAASRDTPMPRSVGMSGRVLASGRPAWVLDVTKDENFARAAVARQAGLHGAIALPVLDESGQVVAVVDFFTSELSQPDQALMEIMSTISVQIGQFLRRKRAEEALAATAHELRLRAAELERSNAELEQFAYVASHDLSEPLRMVAGFVQLLSDRYKGRLDSDADEFIGYTVDGVRRMQSLIDDLLTYSRVGRSVHDGPVDLDEVVEDAQAALRAVIAERNAAIEAEPLPTVIGDARELRQVMQNLLSNALKFVAADQTPQVRVSAARRGDMWEVSVSDNGIGIAPQHSERIFKMFQRLHGRDSYEGTGIGLAICKKTVERHGGTIGVAPAANGGSVFHFTAPAAEERRGSPAAEKGRG
jgi:PAS domain S-box-containing protein